MEIQGFISPPPRGYVEELAKLAGCSRKTVWEALHNGTKGVKSARVRELFQQKYGSTERKVKYLKG